MLRNVAILWDDLLSAFMDMEPDRVYFLDRATGEIFFVRTDMDDAFWQQMDNLHERFLEIPSLDHATERQILNGFINENSDPELRKLLELSLSSHPPYANSADILSFFPEEETKLADQMDRFLSERVRCWLEEHNLFSMSASKNAIN